MDALHTIAFVLQEQNWQSKSTGGPFDMKTYVERAKSSVQAILADPKLKRSSKVRSLGSGVATYTARLAMELVRRATSDKNLVSMRPNI